MSLRLIKPGLGPALRVWPSNHPQAGQQIEPIGFIGGKAVWPCAGGSEDQDDSKFTGDEDDDSDEEDDEDDVEEGDKKKSSKKTSKSSKKADDDDEDDDDDDDDSEARYKASRQARRYRLALRAEQTKTADLQSRLTALEKGKEGKGDEITTAELTDTKAKLAKSDSQVQQLTAQLAFFRVSTIDWADAADAFALAEREGLFEDVVDEDGTVDARELRRGLRDLARRKPHLVKKVEAAKTSGRKANDDDSDEEDDDEQGSKKSSTMNGNRRGKTKTADRAALASKFPVLGSFR